MCIVPIYNKENNVTQIQLVFIFCTAYQSTEKQGILFTWPTQKPQLDHQQYRQLVVLCLPDVCNNKASDRMLDCLVITAAKILDLGAYPMSMCIQFLWGFEVKGHCRSKTHPKLNRLVIVLSGYVPFFTVPLMSKHNLFTMAQSLTAPSLVAGLIRKINYIVNICLIPPFDTKPSILSIKISSLILYVHPKKCIMLASLNRKKITFVILGK